jgi:hypothetical protein
VHIWGIHLKNKRIIFNVDNQAVVAIINNKSSKSNRVMTLVRNLILLSLQYNIMLKISLKRVEMNFCPGSKNSIIGIRKTSPQDMTELSTNYVTFTKFH